MITWFDALLITLLALATALGVRRGLSGLAWGVGGLVTVFVSNMLGLATLPTAAAALVLGAVGGVAISRLMPDPHERPWYQVLGGLGGLVMGGLLVSTLALSFPLSLRVTPAGKQALYPSPDLNPGLHDAVADSAIQAALHRVWSGSVAERTLLLPDQVGHK